MPTPASGLSLKASKVIETSRERPLVTSRAERPSVAVAANAPAASVAAAAQAIRTIRKRLSPVTNATTAVAAKSATKLDCEYEKKSPAKRNAMTPVSTADSAMRFRRPSTMTRSTTIGTTR